MVPAADAGVGVAVNLLLADRSCRCDGVFGRLLDEHGQEIAVTLEHAYESGVEGYSPKIAAGTYTCQRGFHLLHNMTQKFETFEITGVDGHTNMLFHWGNWNRDSDGCILLGKQRVQSDQGDMVTFSKHTFEKFMALQAGLDSFALMVEEST